MLSLPNQQVEFALEGLFKEVGLFIRLIEFDIEVGQGANGESNGPGVGSAKFGSSGQREDAPIVAVVQRVGNAQQRGKRGDAPARRSLEGRELFVRKAGHSAAMIAGNAGNFVPLFARHIGQRRVLNQSERVFVV